MTITPSTAVLRAFNLRHLGHDDKPRTPSQVESMCLALNDALGIPLDADAFEAEFGEQPEPPAPSLASRLAAIRAEVGS